MAKRSLPFLLAVLAAGCAHANPTVAPVAQVDLPRFMGDWFGIGPIPPYPERDAYNAIESYRLRDDGRIQTTFRYRPGSFDAALKTMHPVGTVRPGTNNAVWGMQFVWPVQAEYVIVHLDADYTETIVARSKRDYAWIMARTPVMAPDRYAAAVAKLRYIGYKTEAIRVVPQSWPEKESPKP